MFFRPKSKFQPGQLVIIPSDGSIREREDSYLLIHRRRWTIPTSQATKQWVYDGIIFKVEKGKLVLSTFGSCYLEEILKMIPYLEYPGIGYVRAGNGYVRV